MADSKESKARIKINKLLGFSFFGCLFLITGFCVYPITQAQAAGELSAPPASLCSITRDLKFGMISPDVKELQKYLNNNLFPLAQTGVGSKGRETVFFGSLTKETLIKFQKAYKILPAAGYFGLITRNAVNKICTSVTSPSVVGGSVNNNQQPADQTNNQVNQNIKSAYYTIGGSITGIAGAVVLQNNGQDDLTIDIGQNSNFTFPTAVANGVNYNVTVKPKYSGQACYVYNNIGVVNGANIESVKIACGANLSYNPFTFIPSGSGRSSVTTYSLTYTAGAGGTISGTDSQTVNSGSNGSAVTAAPNTGYHFVNWNDDSTANPRTDSSVTGNKSVTASFAINTYAVAFDANGSTDGTKPAGQTKTYDVTLVLAANSGTLAKTGYTFSGWNTLADGTGTDYAEDANYTANAGITLYAKWTINTYTVTFNTNEGDGGSTATQTLNYNTPTALTTNGFTKNGYIFAGWATTTDGTIAYANGASYTIGAGNVTLYAKWTIIAIGDSYQGGKVAYILQAGDPGYVAGQIQGLIAATTDQGMGAWHGSNSGTTGATATAIGAGQANTNAIIALYGAESNPAKLCDDYSNGGYSDWYLPSKDELNPLYINRVAIGNFTINSYWSSSENNNTSAWYQNFYNGNQDFAGKWSSSNTRCVRSIGTGVTAIGNITGTTTVGSLLTAGSLTPSEATVSYQWRSAATAAGTYSNITGATSSTYTLATTDLGKYIKVVATGTGSYTGIVTSSATAVILGNVTFNYNGSSVTYGTVQNATTGKVWLDRNLGATRVAQTSIDYLAYGDSFQWGRPDDGHQLINWTNSSYGVRVNGTQSGQVANVVPGTNTFIIPEYDWSSIDSDGAIRSANWSKIDGTSICPTGFRVPTDAELTAERMSWSSNNLAGAFASPLKLTVAGWRYHGDDSLVHASSYGLYWSSSINNTYSSYLLFQVGDADIFSDSRANGLAVRCIKD
jgi:uncharacterized repeat protein (TIGR02543 family)